MNFSAVYRGCVILIFTFMLLPFCAQAGQRDGLTILTSSHPPYGYVENGENKGFCSKIVQTILADLKIDVPITTLPWPRAYNTALKSKNTLIYTLARTPKRENLFQWVGVIISGKNYLYSLRSIQIRLTSLGEAEKYRIGAIRDDIRTEYIMNKGLTNLDLVADGEINAVKLLTGRIDLFLADELSTIYLFKKLGYDPHKILDKAYELDLVLHGYLAFSKNSDPELVKRFKKTLEKMKADGRYTDIIKSYI